MTPTEPPLIDLPEEGPFPVWGWGDLMLVLGAVLPAFFGSAAIVAAMRSAFGGMGKAADALLLQFLAYAVLFGVMVAILRIRYGRPFWDAISWSGTVRAVVASLALGPILAVAVLFAAAGLDAPSVQNPVQELMTGGKSTLLIGFFVTTLGPLCEELAFRGFLQPLMARALGATLGILITSGAFALLHGPMYGWSWRHVTLIGVAGTAFGWTRFQTGSTAAAAAMHATYNLAFFLAFLYSEGDSLRPW